MKVINNPILKKISKFLDDNSHIAFLIFVFVTSLVFINSEKFVGNIRGIMSNESCNSCLDKSNIESETNTLFKRVNDGVERARLASARKFTTPLNVSFGMDGRDNNCKYNVGNYYKYIYDCGRYTDISPEKKIIHSNNQRIYNNGFCYPDVYINENTCNGVLDNVRVYREDSNGKRIRLPDTLLKKRNNKNISISITDDTDPRGYILHPKGYLDTLNKSLLDDSKNEINSCYSWNGRRWKGISPRQPVNTVCGLSQCVPC